MHVLTRLSCALLLTVIAAGFGPSTTASAAEPDDPGRLMLVLDSSGSMKETTGGGQTRIQAARAGLKTVIDGLPETQEVGMRVYGSEVFSRDDKGACTDSKRVVDLGTDNRDELSRAATAYKPYGETPIGYALQQAGQDLGTDGQRTIVLVSDGEPTCDPDPCRVAEQLSDDGIELKIDVVGLDVAGKARNKLKCIAEAGNGTYVDADDAESLSAGLTESSTRSSRPFDLTGTPVKGAATAGSAPTIKTGQYLDTIPLNDGLWYKVKRTTKNSTIHVGVTHLSDDIGNSGTKMSVKTYADPAGVYCSQNMSFPLGRLGFAGVTSWDDDPASECNVSGSMFVHVEPSSSAGDAAGEPVEIAVYEEPPLADPTGRDLTAAPDEPGWTTLKLGTPKTDVVPGTSISNAPVVSDGTYALDINPGEAQVLAVPVDWGQNVQAQFDAKLDEEILSGGGSGPYLQFLGPVRGRGSVDFYGNEPSDWQPGSWGLSVPRGTKTFREGAQTQTIGYLNRASTELYVDGASTPGLRYIQVTHDSDDGAPMDYTLTLKTNGTAGTGAPEYAKVKGLTPPAADSPLVTAAKSTTRDEAKGSSADTSEDSFPLLPVALGAAAVLAGLAGTAYYLTRREGRGSSQ